ncbi:saxitoxin and tetrodotoxin-binding protein 2-like isoform X2 [Betta splendens]|uniref:Saxitoxin and tetrodotoxin-binding protein 2-like isoform X2 n=1 Tax=Betta splendens TaxID=158456 RepID=A0A6P7P0D5_BETSP|nr:saxitoxin and tetrodotoxin-binding protein 2-like isoform X2 [Betta splendens]
MRGAVKCVVLLLVAIGSNAAPTTEECEVLTRKLQTKDVHRNFGDWVLAWAVSDYELGSGLLANLSSSRASFQLLVPNSRTIVYKEKNTFSDGVCASFFFNLHVPSDASDPTLQVKSGTLLKHGTVRAITSTSVVFFETGPDRLLMLYQGPLGRYLLSYRRDGRHSDGEQLKAAHDDLRKLAECVGFAHDKPFIYNGAAGPTCKLCDGVNGRLPTEDLHKVYGSWVLVWSVSDHKEGQDLLSNVSSSHIELHLLSDKKTVMLNERNVYTDKSCSNYVINLALPSDPSDAGHHTLHMVSATVEVDGVVKPYNDSAALDFYQTCPDCLLVVYKYVHGRFLLSYRRDGRHSDVEQLKAAHDDLRKLAECVGFAHDKPFIYNGAAVGYEAVPTCKKCEGLNSRLPTKDLDQIFGAWVLVWSVSDHDKGWDLLQNVSSSHVELQLLPDKRGAVFNERNLYKDKSCSNYVINLALPSDLSDAGHHTLHMVSATVEVDGVVKPYNDSAALDFYQTCPDCLLVVYKYVHGRFLLSYRRERHHSDAQRLKAAHDDHRKQSECLGFQHHSPFSYDGEAEFCYKKSALEKHQAS